LREQRFAQGIKKEEINKRAEKRKIKKELNKKFLIK